LALLAEVSMACLPLIISKKIGCDITILEQGNLANGCSFGNAGMILLSKLLFQGLAKSGEVACAWQERRLLMLFENAETEPETRYEATQMRGLWKISGTDLSINPTACAVLCNLSVSITLIWPLPMPDMATVWCGLRPCSPNGLPYIWGYKTI